MRWFKDPQFMRREYGGLTVWMWLACLASAVVIIIALGFAFHS